MRPIKAVVVEPVGGHGGMNHYDFNLCEALADAGVDVTLLTSDATPEPKRPCFRIDRRFQDVFGSAPAWRRGLRYVRALVFGLAAARRKGSKVAHFHFFNVGPLQALGVVTARVFGMQTVATVHDVEAFKAGLSHPRFERIAYRLCGAVIVHNEVSRSELAKRSLVRVARLHVVNAGNHASLVSQAPTLSKAAAAELLGVEPAKFVVVFFGQIKEVKGLGLLLRAVGMLRRKGIEDLTLVVGGRTWKHDFSEYQKVIDDENIADIVKLHLRYVSDMELPLFYRAADLMVMPYLRIYQSDVLLMAMSFGTPILVSDLPGMLEVVKAQHSARVFRSGDIEDLAREINWAMDNRLALAKLAGNALVRMETDFGWESVGRRLQSIYGSLGHPANRGSHSSSPV